MKKILIGLLALGSFSAFAQGLPIADAKVICGESTLSEVDTALSRLEKKISTAKAEGYTQISAPSVAKGINGSSSYVCVTVSK